MGLEALAGKRVRPAVTPPRTNVVAVFLFLAFAGAGVAYAVHDGTPPGVGLGLGLAYASMTNLVVHNVPAHQTGVASGMNANIRNIGGAIGNALVSSVITSGRQPGGVPREAG